jgi:hypothetical protein
MKRAKLIDTILDLAGDEIETKIEAIGLAKKSKKELVDDIISIAEYYKTESNN